jgi:hypothetical protein
MTAESTAVCDQQTERRSRSRGAQRLRRATNRRPSPARKQVDGCAQFAQTCRDSASGIVDACGPGSPDSHRVVWGLTSRPPVPPRAFLRFPVCPPGSPPSPAFLWFPFVRRSPVRPLRPLPGFRFPFGVPPGSLPLSNLHDSAAERRFRRRWSRAARAKVTSPAATTPRLDLAVIRPALQTGSGWARGDAATESPVTSGPERRTPPRPNTTRLRRLRARVSRAVDHRELPCRPGRRAVPRLQRAAMITGGRLPGRRPRTGQAAAPSANTSRNGAGAGPVLCYSRWVNITELVIFHRRGGSSPPSDTLNPHSWPFPGMLGCHPSAGLRQCRATGRLPSLLSDRGR